MSGIQFSALVTETTVTFTGVDGKNYVVGKGHPNITLIQESLKSLQRFMRSTDPDAAYAEWNRLTELADIKIFLNRTTGGKIQVIDGVVYYSGEVVHHPITRRIIWAIQEGYDPTPYMIFLEHLLENPSKAAVDQLYTFMEHNNMGITDDGYMITYKAVREDYTDQWSGTISNKVGEVVKMRRNLVQDDPNVTCAPGLHVCEMRYLRWFGTGRGYHIMICKVNPKNVVSVPVDHDNGKIRCCEYEVIGEYSGADKQSILRGDPLSEKPIFSRKDFAPDIETYDEVYITATHSSGERRFVNGDIHSYGLRAYQYGASIYDKHEAAELCIHLREDPEMSGWAFALVSIDEDDLEGSEPYDDDPGDPGMDVNETMGILPVEPAAGLPAEYVIVASYEGTEVYVQSYSKPPQSSFSTSADIDSAKRLSFSEAIAWMADLEKYWNVLSYTARAVPRRVEGE